MIFFAPPPDPNTEVLDAARSLVRPERLCSSVAGWGGGGATGADKQQTPPSDDVTGPEEEEDDDEFLDHPAPIYRRGGSDRVITGHEFSTRQRI